MLTWLVKAGRDAVRGLAAGIRAEAGTPKAAISAIGESIVAEFQTGMEIASPSRRFARIASWIPAGIAKAIQGGRQRAVIEMQRLMAQVAQTGSRHAEAVVRSVAPRLIRLGGAWETLVARAKTAQSQLQALTSASAQLSADTAAKIMSLGDVTQASGVGQEPVNGRDIADHLRTALTTARAFGGAIAALRRQGLNTQTLSQLVAAGPEQGLTAARGILGTGRSAIVQINSLQAQLARTATATGGQVADAMYGSGIRAARGLVAGIRSQEAAVLREIARLTARMVAQVKRTLRIRSPSGVFADDVGRWIPAGIARGIDRGMPQVHASLGRVPVGVPAPRAQGITGRGGGQIVEIHSHLHLDGEKLRTAIQRRTLEYNRRNTANGLTFQGLQAT
jgi:hypothetical protein